MKDKTWSRGHLCRLPFGVNLILNLSISYYSGIVLEMI